LLENTFDRKRIFANPSPNPNFNPITLTLTPCSDVARVPYGQGRNQDFAKGGGA